MLSTTALTQSPRVLLVMRHFVESFSQFPDVLSLAGVRVDVIGTSRTRHIRHCPTVDNFTEISEEAEAFARELTTEIGKNSYDSIMLVDEPSLTAVLTNLDKNENFPTSCLPFALDSPLAVALGDKARFYDLCKEHHIPHPRTEMADSIEEAERTALSIGLPCVLKGKTGSGGDSVYLIHNRQQLSLQLNHWKHDFPIIVQQFISGMVGATTYFSYKGELRSWIAITKNLTLNDGKGPTVAAKFVVTPAIEEACAKFAELGNYTGITGFDFMMSKNGEIFVIDPHFGRLTTIIHMGPICGVDFGVSVRDALQGKGEMQQPNASDIIAVKFPEFINYSLTGGFWRLMRLAPPLAPHVRYCYNPRLGLKLNFALAKHSVMKSLRWRRDVTTGIIRKPLSRVKQGVHKGIARFRG